MTFSSLQSLVIISNQRISSQECELKTIGNEQLCIVFNGNIRNSLKLKITTLNLFCLQKTLHCTFPLTPPEICLQHSVQLANLFSAFRIGRSFMQTHGTDKKLLTCTEEMKKLSICEFSERESGVDFGPLHLHGLKMLVAKPPKTT